MKIMLSVEHPAWAHQFRYVIRGLEKHGHHVKVVAIKKDVDLELLDAFRIPYEIISNSSGKNTFEKGMIFLNTTAKIFRSSLRFKPDVYIGRASPMMAINSFLFRKKHILFEDTEHSRFCLAICKTLSSVIVTSTSFQRDLGEKQMRVDTYKELFYLHPHYFKPDPSVLEVLDLAENDRFVVLRFVAWDSHHDRGQSGLDLDTKRRLIREIGQRARIVISSESPLPEEFEQYRIRTRVDQFHDLLYYASLCITEGSTTASECAVLGTPAIYVNTLHPGSVRELQTKWGLVSCFCDRHISQTQILETAIDLLQKPDLKEEWREKRGRLLADKIDVTQFMVDLVESYGGHLPEEVLS